MVNYILNLMVQTSCKYLLLPTVNIVMSLPCLMCGFNPIEFYWVYVPTYCYSQGNLQCNQAVCSDFAAELLVEAIISQEQNVSTTEVIQHFNTTSVHVICHQSLSLVVHGILYLQILYWIGCACNISTQKCDRRLVDALVKRIRCATKDKESKQWGIACIQLESWFVPFITFILLENYARIAIC